MQSNDSSKKGAVGGGPSLGALAKTHLASASSANKENNQFHIPDIFGASSSNSNSKPQTGTTAPGNFQIPDLFGTSGSSEKAAPAAAAGIVIPDIFGSSNTTPTNKPDSSSSSSPIDLMRALKIGDSKAKQPSPVKKSNEIEAESVRDEVGLKSKSESAVEDFFRQLLAANAGWASAKTTTTTTAKKQCSPFGRVVCRTFPDNSAKLMLKKPEIVQTNIKAFSFDTPSPDDIVIKAQEARFSRPQQHRTIKS